MRTGFLQRSLRLLSLFVAAVAASAQPRIECTVDEGWKFLRGDAPAAEGVGYPDAGWDRISLPHTWNGRDGQDGGRDYYRGVGWYRKSLVLGPEYRHRSIFLKFDGRRWRRRYS